MTKLDFLAALEKELKTVHVPDIDDILLDFSLHFDSKLSDGYSEEETAAKLASPREIALQFLSVSSDSTSSNKKSVFIALALFIPDLCVAMLFLLFYSTILTLTLCSISSLALAVSTITSTPDSLWNFLPNLPFFSALFFSISFLALASLFAMAAEYSRLYINHLLKAFLRWHSSLLSFSSARPSPPLSLIPLIKPTKRRFMRSLSLIALFIFFICAAFGYFSACAAASSFEPWHVWGWFI